MESKKSRKLFNIIMIAIILIIALGGILAVGNIKGWFKDSGSLSENVEKVHDIVAADELSKTEASGDEKEAGTTIQSGATDTKDQSGTLSGKGTQDISKDTEKPATDNKINNNQGATKPENSEAVQPAKTCTVEIRCDTLLNNMDKLKAGKAGYVPSNGTILKTTDVEFQEGETVFDVLKKVCGSQGIQLEYSWSPVYGTGYVEGINHLYEYDCGDQSGWIFKVNGWSPNYGASAYYLENGDSIKWLYSCEGYGADVS